jgi:hypothetical protein
MRRTHLSINQILSWADLYHERTGQWPQRDTLFVYNAIGEKWYNIDRALRRGNRGLAGKSSLAQLLSERRGYRNSKRLPALLEKTILAWADAFHSHCQKWPAKNSGPILLAPCETWSGVDMALAKGYRGLPGQSSLAQLLTKRRGVRNINRLRPFTVKAILGWADAYYQHHRKWPNRRSGPIARVPGETWGAVHTALRRGLRGLPKGSSLPRFLELYRGVRNISHLPRLTDRRILRWADSYHRCTGKWPNTRSGPIQDSKGETWMNIQNALHLGLRGLPKGSSLFRFLKRHRRFSKSAGCSYSEK